MLAQILDDGTRIYERKVPYTKKDGTVTYRVKRTSYKPKPKDPRKAHLKALVKTLKQSKPSAETLRLLELLIV